MIEFKDVHVSYEASAPILKGVNFAIRDGEFVAFVGTNGAGKSTTMRLMNGLLKPDAGQVLIDGGSTAELRTSELARRVGFLFQNPDRQAEEALEAALQYIHGEKPESKIMIPFELVTADNVDDYVQYSQK